MTIDTFFNETELALFSRQANFTFGEYYLSGDGTILAKDNQSGQIFIGKDLLKSNLHPMDTLVSVDLEEDHIIKISFKDSPAAHIIAKKTDAEAIVAELRSCMESNETCEPADSVDPDEEEQKQTPEETIPFQSNKEMNEFYSRLVNTGRSKAIAYLVEETGMGVNEACEYVDSMKEREETEESVTDPDFNRDGSITRKGILEVLQNLHPGDMIHVEYKPLIGKLRIYDAKYLELRVEVIQSRYFSLDVNGEDYRSLMNNLTDELFDWMHIKVLNPISHSESGCKLTRVKMLKIL